MTSTVNSRIIRPSIIEEEPTLNSRIIRPNIIVEDSAICIAPQKKHDDEFISH